MCYLAIVWPNPTRCACTSGCCACHCSAASWQCSNDWSLFCFSFLFFLCFFCFTTKPPVKYFETGGYGHHKYCYTLDFNIFQHITGSLGSFRQMFGKKKLLPWVARWRRGWCCRFIQWSFWVLCSCCCDRLEICPLFIPPSPWEWLQPHQLMDTWMDGRWLLYLDQSVKCRLIAEVSLQWWPNVETHGFHWTAAMLHNRGWAPVLHNDKRIVWLLCRCMRSCRCQTWDPNNMSQTRSGCNHVIRM